MHNEPVAWHVSLAGRALSTRIERGLSAHGIGRGEYRVLFALYSEEGLTQAELVERHHLDKGAVARVVGRLVEKGYVKRHPDPEDNRRKLLFLTDDGEALRTEVNEVKDAIDAELTRGLTDGETAALREGLATVIENLGIDMRRETA
jgi:DNA-binding MarR family transcriptional regulator